MKRLSYFIFAAALVFSCGTTEDEAHPELPSSEMEVSNGLAPRPLQDLFISDMSYGLFYAPDEFGQALAIYNGKIVSHEDFPDATFELAKINPNAPNGYYISSNNARISFTSSHIGVMTAATTNRYLKCYTSYESESLNCPFGFAGFITYKIEECYSLLTGALVSYTRTEHSRVNCMDLHLELLEIEPAMWELADGTRIDPWLLFEGLY